MRRWSITFTFSCLQNGSELCLYQSPRMTKSFFKVKSSFLHPDASELLGIALSGNRALLPGYCDQPLNINSVLISLQVAI
jgi:hypothetical protein